MTTITTDGGDSSLSSLIRPTLDPAALHGLPGDVVRTLAPHTEADPAALLLHFLSMFGNVVGAGPHTPIGTTPQPARLFVLIVGHAADARKGTAGDAIEDLMERAEPEWFGARVQRGIQSAEALIRLVDDTHSDDRRLLVFETEFGRLLATLAQRGNLSAVMKAAFDGKTLATTTKDERRSLKATRPHISIVGHVQPGVLASLPEIELSSGFANRFLYGVVGRQQLLPDGGTDLDDAKVDSLTERIHDAADHAWEYALAEVDPISRRLHEHFGSQPSVVLPRSHDFAERWIELYGFGDTPGPLNQHAAGVLGEVTSRAPTHVLRLAMTYALADSSPTLELQHLDAAFAVWQFCAASAKTIFGSLTGNRDVDAVVKELHRATDHTITRTEISVLLHRHRSTRQLDAICDALLDTGLVAHRRDSTGAGRPTDVYTLTVAALGEPAKKAKEGLQ